jgi:hypothetical protein
LIGIKGIAFPNCKSPAAPGFFLYLAPWKATLKATISRCFHLALVCKNSRVYDRFQVVARRRANDNASAKRAKTRDKMHQT